MKPSKATLRAGFLRVVERFNAGEFDIPTFWEEVEVLNRAGVHGAIKAGRETDAVARLTWALDLHDARLQPRPGLLGRFKDTLGLVFRNEYRIRPEEVRGRAIAVERIMKQLSMNDGSP
jgi:hypothetical protein